MRDQRSVLGSLGYLGAMALAAVVAAPLAGATEYRFSEDTFSKHPADLSNIIITDVSTTYDDVSQMFTWEASFDPDPSVPLDRTLPTGFVLVVNDGPMPKGNVGQLAAIYFDGGNDPNDPIITAYAYNGANAVSAYEFGIDPMFVADQPPDQIISSLNDDSFVKDAAVVDNSDGSRTIRMSIDATPINNHTPLYTPYDYMDDEPLAEGWFGIGYAAEIGIWFHPYIVTGDYYESGDQQGFLLNGADGDGWDRGRDSYSFYDVANLPTVPEPAAAALLAGGLLMLTRRRG